MSVAILMGSASDLPAMQPAADVLKELGIEHQVRVMSAHRTPARVAELATGAAERAIKVFICGAGGAAHLAGVVAAHTLLPVIGVPLNRSLGGLDSLYATVQMPAGIPVATVAIDGAANAALLAAQMMALRTSRICSRPPASITTRAPMASRVSVLPTRVIRSVCGASSASRSS
jgi:5-(carboxyamino)imidazole ribonucleotide mutase